MAGVSGLLLLLYGCASPTPRVAAEAAVGEDGAGTWTLHASDAIPQDSGSLRAFGIDVYGYSCAP